MWSKKWFTPRYLVTWFMHDFIGFTIKSIKNVHLFSGSTEKRVLNYCHPAVRLEVVRRTELLFEWKNRSSISHFPCKQYFSNNSRIQQSKIKKLIFLYKTSTIFNTCKLFGLISFSVTYFSKLFLKQVIYSGS